MDITTIVGVVAGFGIMIAGILQSGSLSNFFDPASIFIVIGGTLAAVFASFPLSTLKNIPKHFKIVIQGNKFDAAPLVESLVEFAQLARKMACWLWKRRQTNWKIRFISEASC